MVLGQGLLLTLCGGVIGLAAAIASARLVVTLMPSTQPGDPVALVASAVLLLAVAAAASILPARRAARVDPMVALRNE